MQGTKNIEVLNFINHTQCHCVDRTGVSPEVRSPPSRTAKEMRPQTTKAPSERICSCAPPFKSFVNVYNPMDQLGCRCDCEAMSESCLSLKKGKKPFKYAASRFVHLKSLWQIQQSKHFLRFSCIQDGMCIIPKCAYGNYSIATARCPAEPVTSISRALSFDWATSSQLIIS